jgi:hypothetical protein
MIDRAVNIFLGNTARWHCFYIKGQDRAEDREPSLEQENPTPPYQEMTEI